MYLDNEELLLKPRHNFLSALSSQIWNFNMYTQGNILDGILKLAKKSDK